MDTRSFWYATIVLVLVLLVSCTSPAVTWIEIDYPRCEVSEKDSSRSTVIVEVKCPGEAPFTKIFHKKK